MSARIPVPVLLSSLLLGAFLPSCGDAAERPTSGDTDPGGAAAVAESAAVPVAPTRDTAMAADPAAAATRPSATGGSSAGEVDPDRPTADQAADQPAAPAPAPEPSGGDPATGPETGVSPASPSDSILRATSRAYESVRSIRATFEQRLENPLLGRTTRSAGTIYQRQPDRFLMEFSDPAGDVIVSDGEYFWMWYPSVDSTQVLRTRRAGTGLDLRAQFIGDPVRRFEATYQGTEPVRGRTAHVLTLVPREPAAYTRLKAWIDARDHLVRRFELTESSGTVRHFELTDLAVNPALPDDLFTFTPPAGARVVTR